ncbi:hypothetical protein BH18CHL2_BH18CHL2_01170 [soil metagenome]
MCRSIKTLRRAQAPATEAEIRAAALQFVRKVSGMRSPTRGHEGEFDRAVNEVASSSRALLQALGRPRGASRADGAAAVPGA